MPVRLMLLCLAILMGSTHDVGANANAAPDPGPARSFTATRATGAITIDGELDDPGWADALVFDLPYEWNPGDNATPPVTTDFLLTYDDKHLYAAWRAHDPDPSAIRAHIMDRDEVGTLVQDDHVVLMVDTYNDERRAFQFRVNPLGVQAEAIFSEDGIEDFSFDLIWDSAGKINDRGYVIEIAIPFDQLRFPRTEGAQTWGFDVGRSYPRSVRHRISASPRDRGNTCLLCQATKVTGFADLEPGRNLEIVPTVTGSRTEARAPFPNGDFESQGDDSEAGVSVRWGMTPSLTLNATVNPDFSQVEADVAQLAVNNRFALFFPEQRPFFLEGVDIFDTPVNAVFTRTVADPDWGLKLSGKEGKNGIGVFVAQDTVNNLLLPSNQRSRVTSRQDDVLSGVLRYRRDVGTGSSVGVLYAGREGDREDYRNDVYGADAFVRIDDANTLRLQYLRSDTRYPQAVADNLGQPTGDFSGDAIFADWNHGSRHWNGSLEYISYDEGFRADSGFVSRVDVERVNGFVERRFYGGDDHWWNRANIGVFSTRVQDQAGTLTDQVIDLFANVSGPLQSFLEVSLERNRERFGGILHEDLTRVQVFGSFQPSGRLRLSMFVDTGDVVDFFNNQPADQLVLEPSAEVKLGQHINVKLDHRRQTLDVPGGELFTANLSQLRVVYNVNVRMFVRVILQRFDITRTTSLFPTAITPDEEELFTQLLFSYKLNPQTVLFAGYSDNRFGDDNLSLTQADRTVFVKLGYAWTL